jgi:hypothetical protein
LLIGDGWFWIENRFVRGFWVSISTHPSTIL